MTDLDRYLIERAARALWDEPGWEQASPEQRQHHREAAERALSAVADQLRAEGVDDCAAVHEADAEQCPDPDGCRTPTLCRQMNLQVAAALRAHAAKLREAGR